MWGPNWTMEMSKSELSKWNLWEERQNALGWTWKKERKKIIELKITRKIRNKRPRGSNKLAESKERGWPKYWRITNLVCVMYQQMHNWSTIYYTVLYWTAPTCFDYPDWGFFVLFPQFYGKCQSKTRKDGARPALFQISCYLCCSIYCLCINLYCTTAIGC